MPEEYLQRVFNEMLSKIKLSWSFLYKFINHKNFIILLNDLYVKEFYDIENNLTFPAIGNLLNGLHRTPFLEVKVVIVGEGPYPDDCANGVAFECGDLLRPSLETILAEVERDMKQIIPDKSGSLEHWTKQGVLMINYFLTSGKHGTHSDNNSYILAKEVVKTLMQYKTHIVFMLWGTKSRALTSLIDSKYHHTLLADHPSPRAGAFYGCKHFSQCNTYLRKNNITEIKWIK
jgi:uracil-DNA glycosylase